MVVCVEWLVQILVQVDVHVHVHIHEHCNDVSQSSKLTMQWNHRFGNS